MTLDAQDRGLITTTRGLVGGKLQTHDQVIASGKNLGKKNATTPYTQAISEARSKWNNKKTKNQYSEVKPESTQDGGPGSATLDLSAIGRVSPMLAKDFKKDSNKLMWDEGVLCQVKLDGVRALCGIENGQVFLKSRGNKYYQNLGHIRTAFQKVYDSGTPTSILFDCELYSDRLKFEDITGICRKQKRLTDVEQEKEGLIEAHLFDLFDLSQPELTFHERYAWLQKLVSGSGKSLVTVDTWGSVTKENLERLHSKAKEGGYEGIMLRNKMGKYKPGPTRSNDLIKMKSMIDEEFLIIGFKEGVGQEAGTVIWICQTESGAEFAVRPTGTRGMRREWYNEGNAYLGKFLTVRFQEWSKDGIPRFPVGVVVRDYE